MVAGEVRGPLDLEAVADAIFEIRRIGTCYRGRRIHELVVWVVRIGRESPLEEGEESSEQAAG